MDVLDSNEFAVLELLAIKPLTFFPPLPRLIAAAGPQRPSKISGRTLASHC